MELLYLFGIPLGAAVIPGWVSYATAKSESPGVLWLWGILWLLGTGGLWMAAENAAGWDALGYVIGLFFVAAPAAVGLLVGAIVGHARRSRHQPLPPLPNAR